mgnify:CR=1 FL=1
MKTEESAENSIHRFTRSRKLAKRESPPVKVEPKPKRVKTERRGPAVKEESDNEPFLDSATPIELPESKKGIETKAKATLTGSPFPNFAHPTPQECSAVHKTLAHLHGERQRPSKVVAPTNLAGCGNSPSVLDALVRTILSQNTSDKNSSRAKQSMDQAYGGSDKWEDIVKGGQPFLEKTIKSGGLSVVKSKVIINILHTVKEKHGEYSLDHLFQATDEDAMKELVSFPGVGPKTASCVLLFCLQRPSFAVDTHVYRLTGQLGWRPKKANREQAQLHLDSMVPNDLKYPLHVLLIAHGKRCAACKAGSKGSCELRKMAV